METCLEQRVSFFKYLTYTLPKAMFVILLLMIPDLSKTDIRDFFCFMGSLYFKG